MNNTELIARAREAQEAAEEDFYSACDPALIGELADGLEAAQPAPQVPMTEQEQIEFLKERSDYHLNNLQEISRDEMLHFLPAMLANKDLAAYAAGLAARVQEVWQVNNKVFSVLFATEAQADKFIGASSPATGIQKRRIDVLQPEPKPNILQTN